MEKEEREDEREERTQESGRHDCFHLEQKREERNRGKDEEGAASSYRLG